MQSSRRRSGVGGLLQPFSSSGILSVLLAGVLCAVSAPPVWARDWDRGEPLEVTADRIEHHREHQLYTADGRVRIVQGDRTIDADWAAFSNETGRGVASGNVVVRDGGEVLEARFFEFELESLQGQVFDGEFDTGEGGFRIAARELVKSGDRTYSLRKGSFTTCRCPEGDRTPWYIRASKAEVTLGGYAVARNTTVNVLGVPLIWFPWLIYPVKSDRESGLLFPRIKQSSRNGFEFGLPIFWAAHDRINVTVTPAYLTKRGFKPDLDIDYVFGERSRGGLFGSWVDDQEWSSSIQSDPYVEHRWAAGWRHDQFLPADWRLNADVELVSDNNYVDDFPDDLEEHRRDRFLESQIFAFNHFGAGDWIGATGSVAYADDLQNPDDGDRDKGLLHRFPAVFVEALPEPIGRTGIVASFDTDYINFRALGHLDDISVGPAGDGYFLDVGVDGQSNFVENDGIANAVGVFPDRNLDAFLDPATGLPILGNGVPIGGPEGDGVFQEGEPLGDRGHRMILHPRLAYPLRVADRFEVYPEIGYQQTLYWTRRQDFEERGLVTARLDTRARMIGNLDLPGGLPTVRHVFEPRLGWALVSHRTQRGNPLFVPRTAVPQRRIRQLALDNFVRDSADRIESANVVALAFGNRFYVPGRSGRADSLRADVTLSADYDFADGGFGRIVLDGTSQPSTWLRTRFNLSVDPDRGHVDEGRLDLYVPLPNSSSVGVGYRYLRQIPAFFEAFRTADDRFADFRSGGQSIHQVDLRMRLRLGKRWALLYTGRFSFETEGFLTNRAGVEYVSKCRCWAVGIDVEDDRSRGIQYRARFTLLGLGDDPRRPFAGGRGLSAINFGGGN